MSKIPFPLQAHPNTGTTHLFHVCSIIKSFSRPAHNSIFAPPNIWYEWKFLKTGNYNYATFQLDRIIPYFGLENTNVCSFGRFHVSQAVNLPSLYFLSIYQTGWGADIALAISLWSIWEQTWRRFQHILMINYMKATLIHLQCRITCNVVIYSMWMNILQWLWS